MMACTALSLYYSSPRTKADEKAREDGGATYFRHIAALKSVLEAWKEFCAAQGTDGHVFLRAVRGEVPEWLVDLRECGVFNLIEPDPAEQAAARKLFDRFAIL